MSGYPGEARDWGSNPVYWSYAKLFIKQIHALSIDRGTRCEHLLNGYHPLSRAQVLGHVVASAQKSTHLMYVIDDGTGVIQCTVWTQTKEGLDRNVAHVKPSLGDKVRVLGKLRIPRWGSHQLDAILEEVERNGPGNLRRELVVEELQLVTDVNEEVLHWVSSTRLWKQVYTQPPQSLKRKRKPVPPQVLELSEIILDSVRMAQNVNFGPDLTDYERSKVAMASTTFSVEDVSVSPKVRQLLSLTGSEVLATTLKRLRRQGYIYRVDPGRYPGKDYALITHVTTLGPSIVGILQELEATSKSEHLGVWKSEICKQMRKDIRFKYIQEARVERSLHMLIKEGHLKETQTERYVLVLPIDK